MEDSKIVELFRVRCVDEAYSMEHNYPGPGYTIAVTPTQTYYLSLPTDVQYDQTQEQAAAEYLAMCGEVGDIQILLTGWLEKNSVNTSNRVEGGVTVSFLDEDWKTTGTVTCDEEQSRIIREVLGAQDYDREQASFPCDLRIEFSGKEYFMNSSTGQIQPAEGDALGALLSAGDVRTILDQLK